MNLQRAIEIATEAHKNQVDKCGMPYILHPLTLMMRLKEKGYGEDYLCVAVLHDVVEDTEVTLEDIIKEKFNQDVCYGVSQMTHEDGVDYFDYIDEVAKSEIARVVKLEDLKHNTDISRPGIKDLSRKSENKLKNRVWKYTLAYNILSNGDLG